MDAVHWGEQGLQLEIRFMKCTHVNKDFNANGNHLVFHGKDHGNNNAKKGYQNEYRDNVNDDYRH